MKINLLTMHYSLSCGAVMQTYALCSVLKKMGHDVTIINFKNKIELERRKSIKFWIACGLTKIRFDSFRRKYYPNTTSEFYDINYNLLPKADCYLTGSDQIWNPYIVGNNLGTYMLDFLPDEVKRFSYASSFGIEKWDFKVDVTSLAKKSLSKFNCLSVREDSGVAICKKIFNLNAEQVLDPTFLVKDYSNLIGNVKTTNDIVCFKLFGHQDFLKTISFLKEKYSLQATSLYGFMKIDPFDKIERFCSPVKWLKTIAGAKIVITDSFHGVAFSIIFKKEFIVLEGDKKKSTRIKSLLHLLGLSNRFFEDYNDFITNMDVLDKPIDYVKVDSVLQREIDKSMTYLKNSLLLIDND